MSIIGHSTIIKYLSTIIERNNPSHSYLFYGPSYIGKETVALWFAQSLLCSNTKKPCDNCLSCKALQKRIHSDIITVKPHNGDKAIGISQVKEMQNSISKTALYNSYKVVIIKPAELLSLEAANALLKTLEEPPEKSIIILITQNQQKIIPTIRSRTLHIKFSYIPKELIRASLGGNYTDVQKDFIARFAQGKIGYAFSLNDDEIKAIIEREKLMVKLIKSPLYYKLILTQEALERDKIELSSMATIMRDILLFKMGLDEYLMHPYLKGEYKKLNKYFQIKTLINALSDIAAAPKKINANVNKQLIWNNILLRLHDK